MSTRQDLAWWQKLLIFIKLWRVPHVTEHHHVRDLERPEMPEVTGAWGNRVDLGKRRRLVPQSDDRA